MFYVGNRVCLFSNMGKTGVIVELKEIKHKTWMVGGASAPSIDAVVKFDDGEIIQLPSGHLMPLHE